MNSFTSLTTGVPIAALLAALLTGCAPGAAAPDPLGDPPQAVIRVNQVGYGTDEHKHAAVMGADRKLADASFRILDEHGDTVLSGSLGPRSGAWNARYDSVRPVDFTGLTAPGHYTLHVTGSGVELGSTPFEIAATGDLLRPLVDLNVRFLQAQRDGTDIVPDVAQRKPSHLRDASATVYRPPRYADAGTVLLDDRLTPLGVAPVDVSGGWFDAGDFLKFTGTTAYTTANLLLTARHLPDDAALAAEAAFGMRWLEKMWDPTTKTLSLQVGIGNGNDTVRTDHDVWRLPETDDLSAARPGEPDYTISHRPVFTANEPGAPLPPSVAGRVTAAFALDAQRAAAAGDTALARARLDTAADLFSHTDTAPASPAALATAVPAEFYPEASWQDDLEWAATELAIAAAALGDDRAADWQQQAAGWAARYIASDSTGILGVADVSALAHSDLIALGDGSTPQLIADLRRQLDAGVDRSEADPFGAGVDARDFDSAPFAFGSITTAAVYERATGDTAYRPFAQRQRAWVFGANAWGSSFLIGAGTTSPRCPAHQVANLTGQELLGAVVNGPNAADTVNQLNIFDTMKPCSGRAEGGVPYDAFDGQGIRYLDDAGAWQTSEPSVDFTCTALLALSLWSRT